MSQLSTELFEESVSDAFNEVLSKGDYEDANDFIVKLNESGMPELGQYCLKEWEQMQEDSRDRYETLEYARI